jgi:hypothetical protein
MGKRIGCMTIEKRKRRRLALIGLFAHLIVLPVLLTFPIISTH